MSITLAANEFWQFQLPPTSPTQLNFIFNWDNSFPIVQPATSLGGIFRGTQKAPTDCDLAVLLLNAEQQLLNPDAVISFTNPISTCASIKHLSDNLTGNFKQSKQEVIQVVLDTLPKEVSSLLFVLSIYDANYRHQDFSQIKNACLTVSLPNSPPWVQIPLPSMPEAVTLIKLAKLTRQAASWQLKAILESSPLGSLNELCSQHS